MAITRCPYCHAIIDENVKYCNNCGTQLLFADDEGVDEEIPGEKIIDADTEEKDYTIEEPEGESKPKEDPDLDEEIEEETEELALDKLLAEEDGEEDGGEDEADNLTEEVILVDEIKAAEAGGKGESEEPEEKEETAELKSADKGKADDEEEEEDEEEEDEEEGKDLVEEKEIMEADEEKELEEEGEGADAAIPVREAIPAEKPEELPAASEEAEPVIEYITDEQDRDKAEDSEEAAPRPVTFDTQELEGIGKTVDLGKEKIDKFLEVLAEKEAEVETPPKEAREPTGTLPPWASTMKGAPVFPVETGPIGALDPDVAGTATQTGDEEVEIFPRRKDSDSTIGLPERVSQSPLPFEPGAVEVEEGKEEPDDDEAREKIFPTAGPVRTEREAVRPTRESERREAEAEEAGEEPAPRPPFSFSVFFKSKAFDVLFVGLFWLVALWLAANAMDATLFDILGSMSGSMLLLYAVFVFIYFFLFKFFLGETLGDRLFRERE
ncbi:MAG: zinc ribbon domain-containing protein [Candidatus Aminicenantes bacterium]|nr:zinc ribbon domain-containing protein [Candidatus Aminicenantes bacterium]